ncbi:hypothetical protein AAFF_G00087620 [Aldrovandia affinis]|uniref:C2H2-type domain-containing protein n=1 Tax=Aldrovandia affinis TaxID=143900 RepID=A0AAD7RWD1_9TELE|nr:hypothetical protein AAFF_G00087620 [Aldrovandia affinis]
MSELFMECEEEELEPWQRRIPEINLVDDDDDDDEPIFVGEIRSSKVTPPIRPSPAPIVKAVNQRQPLPAATRTVMPVSPVMRAGVAAVTSTQRAVQDGSGGGGGAQSVSCGPAGPIVPQLAVRATPQPVTKSLLIPVVTQAGSLSTVAQTVSRVSHGLSAQSPQPIIINNQGYIVTSSQITNSSTFIASLGGRYPPGTSFTVLPAGQQLLQQVTPGKAVPGVVHRPQVQLIQNNIVTLANVQSPAQPKQPAAQFSPAKPPAAQFSPAKLQPIQMNAATLQPIQVVSSAAQGKLVTPPKPLTCPAAATANQPSPILQVTGNSGIGATAVKRQSPPDSTTNATKKGKLEIGIGATAVKRESPPDSTTNTTKKTKLETGASMVSDSTQNGKPFRKKCPRCKIQFNLPDPMRNHMRYCCSHLIHSIFPTPSKLDKMYPPVLRMDAEKGKLIMLVTEFYYGRHEGDKTDSKEQKTVTFKCNSCLKVLKNNIRFMNHMKHHLELEKQSNESWDSHTTCQHCFRQYDTPFQLQCHIESAHSPYESTTNCKICELAFETEQVLLEHMKDNHKPGEMPYVCQVCNYRSSFFSEVESHFRSVHENTKDLLCPFCLKVLRSGHTYMQHYMKHQKKGIHRCGKCRLNFLTYKEKLEHKTQFHRTFKKPKTLEGLPPGTKVTIRASLLGASPTSPSAPSRSIVSVVPGSPTSDPQGKPHCSTARSKTGNGGKNRPYQSKKQERLNSKLQEQSNEALRNIRNHMGQQTCVECYTKVTDFYSHYPMVLNCGACRYRTCCKKSFENHMIRFHSAVSRDRFRKMKRPRTSLRSITLVCLNCDFLSDGSGTDRMSKHLVDRPHHNCQIIFEKGVYAGGRTKTRPGPEPSTGGGTDRLRPEASTGGGTDRLGSEASTGEDTDRLRPVESTEEDTEDSKSSESEVLSGDSDALDTSRNDKEDPQRDSQTRPAVGSVAERSEAKDSNPAAAADEESEGGDAAPVEPGSLAEKEKREEPSSSPSEPTAPADRETGGPTDDVPFEEFLSKADEQESDAGEQGSAHLEPLTPSKVLEHETTEIFQKSSSSPAAEAQAQAELPPTALRKPSAPPAPARRRNRPRPDDGRECTRSTLTL